MDKRKKVWIPIGIFLAAAIVVIVIGISMREPTLERVEITPEQRTVLVGEKVDFDAVAISTRGSQMEGRTFQWEVEGDAGEIDDTGAFSAVRPGQVTVRAISNGVSESVALEIRPQPVARIEVEPEAPGALPGTALTLRVKAFGEQDVPAGFNEVSVETPTEGTSISQERITLDESGEGQIRVTLAPDRNLIVLRSGEVAEEVQLQSTRVSRVRITPDQERFEAGQTVEFQAVAFDDRGREYSVEATWSVTGASAQMEKDGQVLMRRPGTGVLLVEYEGVKHGHPFTVIPGSVARLEITPESIDLRAGETRNFTSKAFNAHGYPLKAEVQWEVEGNVGSIREDGTFLARTAGEGRVRAVRGDITAEAPVEIEPGPLASIAIELEELSVTAGESINLSAVGLDAFGNRFEISPQWYLSEPLGIIDESKFSAVHSGSGQIRARVGNILGSADIEVGPAELAELRISPLKADMVAGESVEFEVTGLDRFGNRIEVEPELSTRDPLGEIDQSGVFTARRAGSTMVEARVEDFSVRSSVAVKPAELARVTITRDGPVDLVAGVTENFRVRAEDEFGNAVQTNVEWQVRPNLGSFSGEGLFYPTRAGKGQILASVTQLRTDTSLSASVEVNVSPGETARIEVEPSQLTTVAGEETRFTAITFDQFGNRTDVEVDWSLSDPSVGSFQPNRVFVPFKAQAARVIASHGNVSAAAELDIRPAQIAILRILPDRVSLKGGERMPLNVTAKDRFGNTVETDIQWRLSDSEMGRITEDNVLIARRAGEGSIIAAARNIADTVPLEVTVGPVVSIELRPDVNRVSAGSSVDFEAVALDAGGNRVDVEPEWNLEGNIGAINESGVLTAHWAGEGVISAGVGNVRGSTGVEVVPGDPAVVELAPQEIAATAGDAIPVFFRVFDSYGNHISRPSPEWRVENNLGRMSRDNTFLARRAGEGYIQFIAGEATTRIPVTVEPAEIYVIRVEPGSAEMTAGERMGFSAEAFDRYGNRVEFSPTWSVGRGIGTVDEGGALYATTSGSGYVAVQSRNVTGLSVVTVEPGPVAQIRVEPSNVSLAAGEDVKFTATAYDRFGNVTQADMSWSFAEGTELGELTGEAAFEARRVGEGEIVVAAGDVSTRVPVAVEPGELAELRLEPGELTLTAGERSDITIVGRDRFGNRVPVEPEFNVQPENLGRVTQGRRFVAGQAGEGMLIASARGVRASAPVEVSEGDLDRIVIRLPERTIEAGRSYDFRAMGYDEGENEIPVDPRWAVTENIGRIEPDTGIFHAGKAGRGMVVAYSRGVIAERPVEVTPGELHSLFISPNPVTVNSGTALDFQVYGYDSEGNRVDLSTSAAEWSSTGGIGRFQEPGTFLGMSMGRGKVSARVNEREAESYVMVAPGSPDPMNSKIYVTHPALPATGEAYSDVIVEVRDAYNNPVPGVQVTLVTDRQADRIVQPPETNSEGIARGRITSNESGTSTIFAVGGEQRFIDTETLDFG
jgi:uncharacterized protein (AIM24 family)